MAYQVLYRKYRPRDFSEVVGQDHIIAVIKRQITGGRVAHAYLFSGPRGIGKTTTARLIAKAVNCAAERPADRPCQRCASCTAFNAGSALNLIEIDAASNRGIDEIRELREGVRFTPPGGGMKVYIIDEVHQLTKEAFNALLKTLEEPPGHVIFVLATTEIDKVPPTIVSRTQYFDFRRPRQAVLAERITALAGLEGAALQADAAAAIAFAAEGSVRDAESLLGKVLAVAGKTVTRADAEEVLGIPKREALISLFGHIGRREPKEAIEFVNRLYYEGYEMEHLAKMLVSFFRDALLAKTGSPVDASSLLPEDSRALTAALDSYSAAALADATAELIDVIPASRRSPIPQLPLELALIAIIHGRAGGAD
ncbi:MAG: DNA polymerase III subunit gamma/tau [Candidatus Sungbacteria bacterium]|uniref:DNA polymerase III subunit gamma/tau n=1 Tax=Candidatus Sungiibacteriota bacterium TaxID=2750080 RepID=A0A933DRD4_9BACT|nr:DNA polymerase III subunit gamma/tau [Candidatus Sungbacteria bacterium]